MTSLRRLSVIACIALIAVAVGIYAFVAFRSSPAHIHVRNTTGEAILRTTVTTSWGDTLLTPAIASGSERVIVFDNVPVDASYSLTVRWRGDSVVTIRGRPITRGEGVTELVAFDSVRRGAVER